MLTNDDQFLNKSVKAVEDDQFLINAVKDDQVIFFEHLLYCQNLPINVQDKNGDTALMIACQRGYVYQAFALLNYPDIDVNIRNKDGQTALSIACLWPNEKIVQLLMKKDKLDVNSQDNKGNTPLIYATMCQNAEIMLLLLKHKDINITFRNNTGKSAMDIIRSQNNLALFELLENYKHQKMQEPVVNKLLQTLPADELKLPENQQLFKKYAHAYGFENLFQGVEYDKQKVLLDMYASEIKKDKNTLEAIEKIICAQHTAQKVAHKKDVIKNQFVEQEKSKCYN